MNNLLYFYLFFVRSVFCFRLPLHFPSVCYLFSRHPPERLDNFIIIVYNNSGTLRGSLVNLRNIRMNIRRTDHEKDLYQ